MICELLSVVCIDGTVLGYISAHNESIVWIGGALWTLYTFSRWTNYGELLKHCVLASPFALLSALLMKLLGCEMLVSYMVGVLLFNCLLVETPNVRKHYIITLMGVMVPILAVVFARNFIFSRGDNDHKYITIGKMYIVMGCGFAILVFYQSYCARLSKSQKTQELRPIAVKSVKVAGAFFLTLLLLTLSNLLCDHYQISFWISFGLSVLIAAGLWYFCKFFNIKNPAYSDCSQKLINKPKRTDQCESCGKAGLPNDMLFKINSGQRICANCLAKMNDRHGIA
jgi:hypothetical protein